MSPWLAKVEKDGKWGFIDKNGKVVIEPQFDDAGDFSEGFAQVKKDGKYGFIDKSGKVVIEPQFDNVEYFIEGFAQVEKDGKYGFIDKNGKVIEPQFDEVGSFSEGFVCVEKDGKWGFIDKNGKVVIEPQYSSADGFSEQRRTPLPSHRACDVAVGDLNGNGFDDVALCQTRTDTMYSIESPIFCGTSEGIVSEPVWLNTEGARRVFIARTSAENDPQVIFINHFLWLPFSYHLLSFLSLV